MIQEKRSRRQLDEVERERDLILGVMIFGEVGMVQGLSCCGSLVRVHVQQPQKKVYCIRISSYKEPLESLEIFLGVARQRGQIVPGL